jgi:hypothetical protein
MDSLVPVGVCAVVVTILAVGSFILVDLLIVCVAAYKINARSFEFNTVVLKISLSPSRSFHRTTGTKPRDEAHQGRVTSTRLLRRPTSEA